MIEKYSSDTPGAIQERLRYLKEKKELLDELIAYLERYAGYGEPAASTAE